MRRHARQRRRHGAGQGHQHQVDGEATSTRRQCGRGGSCRFQWANGCPTASKSGCRLLLDYMRCGIVNISVNAATAPIAMGGYVRNSESGVGYSVAGSETCSYAQSTIDESRFAPGLVPADCDIRVANWLRHLLHPCRSKRAVAIRAPLFDLVIRNALIATASDALPYLTSASRTDAWSDSAGRWFRGHARSMPRAGW